MTPPKDHPNNQIYALLLSKANLPWQLEVFGGLGDSKAPFLWSSVALYGGSTTPMVLISLVWLWLRFYGRHLFVAPLLWSSPHSLC